MSLECGAMRNHERKKEPMQSQFDNQFAELVARHGEENGGTEDFSVHDHDRIACRYADLSIHRSNDGWHYGSIAEAYATPAECYAHRREDAERSCNTEANTHIKEQ